MKRTCKVINIPVLRETLKKCQREQSKNIVKLAKIMFARDSERTLCVACENWCYDSPEYLQLMQTINATNNCIDELKTIIRAYDAIAKRYENENVINFSLMGESLE